MVNYGSICQLVSMDLGLLCQWLEEKNRIAPILQTHHHDSWTTIQHRFFFSTKFYNLAIARLTINFCFYISKCTENVCNVNFTFVWYEIWKINEYLWSKVHNTLYSEWLCSVRSAHRNISSLTAKNIFFAIQSTVIKMKDFSIVISV